MITDNNEGIWIPVLGGFGGACGSDLHTPTGSTSCNTFTGNTNFALSTSPNTGAYTGTLDAEGNYWGAANGPSGAGSGNGDVVGTNIDFEPFATSACPPPTPTYSCQGFEAPMNLAFLPPAMGGGPIGRKVKKNKVLPFKAILVDSLGNVVTDVVAPPVIQVIFDDGILPLVDVTDDALSNGQGTDGNAFELSGDKWQYNLRTKNYSATGTYTNTMVSGNTDEYLIDPTCTGIFVIE